MTSNRKALTSALDRDGDGKVADDVGRFSLWLIVGAVVVVALLALWGSYAHRTTDTTVVTSKERVCDRNADGGSDCKYLVYTERGTYMVADSILAFRWNSSDVYGQIKPCHRYDITSFGWRFGLASSYPNITSIVDKGRVDGCDPG